MGTDFDPPGTPLASRRSHRTWFDAIEDVIDATIEREEEFEITLEDVEVDVPLRVGSEAPFARWGVQGTVSVEITGRRGPLAEWLRWWYQQYS